MSPDGEELVEILDGKQEALPLAFWDALRQFKAGDIQLSVKEGLKGNSASQTTQTTSSLQGNDQVGVVQAKSSWAENEQENKVYPVNTTNVGPTALAKPSALLEDLNNQILSSQPGPSQGVEQLPLVQPPHDARDPCIPETNPYLLPEWPSTIRQRSFAHAMPSPSKRVFGNHICVWFQLGGWEAFGPNCVRVQDNLALSHGLWLHRKLGLPIVALCVLPPQVEAHLAQHQQKEVDGTVFLQATDDPIYDQASGLMLEHIAHAFVDLHSNLRRLGIHLVGLF
jgi:hypothetical protein